MPATIQTMTIEEVDALFGGEELRFHSYYKYAFTFVGTSDEGHTIEATYGGDADNIYRYEVKAGDGVPFVTCDNWTHVVVFGGTRKVFEWQKD